MATLTRMVKLSYIAGKIANVESSVLLGEVAELVYSISPPVWKEVFFTPELLQGKLAQNKEPVQISANCTRDRKSVV